jgi:hexosaminidase
MSWRGEEGGIAAAQQHHNVIMTPVNWCYFDYYQADPATEPFAIGSLTTVEETYSYEPLPAQLSAEEAKYILGAQGNLWTEYITTGDYAEYMVYPRAIALAEVVWSPKNSRNYDNFVERMKDHRKLMDHWDINYAKHIFESKSDSVK